MTKREETLKIIMDTRKVVHRGNGLISFSCLGDKIEEEDLIETGREIKLEVKNDHYKTTGKKRITLVPIRDERFMPTGIRRFIGQGFCFVNIKVKLKSSNLKIKYKDIKGIVEIAAAEIALIRESTGATELEFMDITDCMKKRKVILEINSKTDMKIIAEDDKYEIDYKEYKKAEKAEIEIAKNRRQREEAIRQWEKKAGHKQY